MSRRLDFYFAPSSPWSYLAVPRIRALVAEHDLDLRMVPFDVIAVFRKNGTKVLGERPLPVQRNRLRELRRWKAFLDMPLTLEPRFFPVDANPACRVLLAAGSPPPVELAWALMRACWAEERNIADPGTLRAVADECGLDGARLTEAANGDEAGRLLEVNTQAAVEHDVFGAPTFLFEGEPYWGQDRIDFVRAAVEKHT